jgi:hypothetical protein
VLFEWLRDRQKEQAHAEIDSLKEITDCAVNSLISLRLITVLFYDPLPRVHAFLKKIIHGATI